MLSCDCGPRANGVRAVGIARTLLALSASLLLFAGCGPGSCLNQRSLRLPSPSGRATAMLYPGGCRDVDLVPQIVLYMRGADPSGVFVVGDRVMDARMRWIGRDTLQISHRVNAKVALRERLIHTGRDTVIVTYKTLIPRTQPPPPPGRTD